MHQWLLATVVFPTIKAMAELCEKHGISFICYIEHRHESGMIYDNITVHVQGDASDEAKNILKAAQGKLK